MGLIFTKPMTPNDINKNIAKNAATYFTTNVKVKNNGSFAYIDPRLVKLILLPAGINIQDNLKIPLIWKSLLINRMNIPVVWSYNKNINNNFNQMAIRLANTPGWSDYAKYIIMTNNNNYMNGNVDINQYSTKIMNESKKNDWSEKFNTGLRFALKYYKYKMKYEKLK